MGKNYRKHGWYDAQDFGQWVAAQRRACGYTLEELARSIGIRHSNARSTMKGVETGARRLDPEKRHKLVEVLTNRRTFLKDTGLALAGLIVATAATSAASPATGSAFPVPISSNMDDRLLAETNYLLATADEMLYRDDLHAHLVLDSAAALYFALLERWHRDPELALAGAHVAERLARAQELTYSWFARSSAAIKTYTHAITQIVLPASDQFRDDVDLTHAHARLLTLRMPMYRELRQYREGWEDAREGIDLAARVDRGDLQVLMLYQIGHTWAALGDEKRWQTALDDAATLLEAHIHGEEGLLGTLLAPIDYYRGEGYKRLAYNHRRLLTWRERRHYAEQGRIHFARALRQVPFHWTEFVRNATLSGHPLLTAVSDAQCLAWIEPKQAIATLDHLKPDAARHLPGLVPKIAFSRRCATLIQSLLAAKPAPDDPVPGFDLDAQYARRSAHPA